MPSATSVSCSRWTTSTIRWPGSASTARSSSTKWSSTKTRIGSATSEAPRAFSLGWPSKSADARHRSGVIPERLAHTSFPPPPVLTRREPGCSDSTRDRRQNPVGSRLRQARNGSLGRVFDHVGIAVSDLAASERFYRTVLSLLGVEPGHADAELVEWDDWAIGPTDRDHPVTRGLHVGFRAPSREAVDAFWQAGIDAGYRDDGAPGSRPVYGPDYYG